MKQDAVSDVTSTVGSNENFENILNTFLNKIKKNNFWRKLMMNYTDKNRCC